MRKRGLARLLLAALLAAAGGALWSVSGPCGPIDRILGASGCLASFSVSDLVVTGDTIATDSEGRLVIAGIDYDPDRRRDLRARMVAVTLDPAIGTEIERVDLNMIGYPDQLRISPDGTRLALSCNALYICDRAGGGPPARTGVMLYDRVGERQWLAGIEHAVAPPDAEGRAFELAFSPSGNVVFAHVAFDAVSGNAIQTREQPLPGPTGTVPAAPIIEVAGQTIALELPEGFIPFLRLSTALSPDGNRIAVLARRFSGPGEMRAVIRVHDLATGERLAAHDIREDLVPPIHWHPQRDAVVIARATAPESGAAAELRLYTAGGEE
ncbi:hypothetical protein GI374_17825 [Paracoccus sp. S-4012]|uniref:hypothetical protein n=1 Tax=Paracoccus sp. S-4012 TaxID=2665648 RepID=UPI0012AF12E4|nr:hypothetical protein [Paracoccus sp. S-4012]MRX52216.1 hypothetical protein [Paracoccus sp. S-4012]